MFFERDFQVVPSGNTITFTTPASVVAGMTLAVKLMHDSPDGVFSDPDGTWTARGQENDPSGAVHYGCFTKTLVAAPAATYAFTYSGTPNMCLGVLLVDSVPVGYVLNAIRFSIIGEDSADGALATTAIAGAAKGTLYCSWAADDNQTGLSSGPSGMTHVPGGALTTADGASGELDAWYQEDPGGGSLSKTETFLSNSQFGAMALFIEYVAAASGNPWYANAQQ